MKRNIMMHQQLIELDWVSRVNILMGGKGERASAKPLGRQLCDRRHECVVGWNRLVAVSDSSDFREFRAKKTISQRDGIIQRSLGGLDEYIRQ